MNFIKDQANACKTCTCGDILKAERVLFGLDVFKLADS